METQDKKIKILLVDNDEMMRIYFRDIFWVHGKNDDYEITEASSLEEAEKIIEDKSTKPDTIFVDLMLSVPGEKNNLSERLKRFISFVQKIKSNKDLASLKIIIFSGKKEKSIEKKTNDLGIDGYLEKGEFMPKEIISFTDKIHATANN